MIFIQHTTERSMERSSCFWTDCEILTLVTASRQASWTTEAILMYLVGVYANAAETRSR